MGNACCLHTDSAIYAAFDLDQWQAQNASFWQGFAYWGVNNVTLNFDSQPPKNWKFGLMNRTFKREWQKSNTTSTNITKFLRRIAPMNGSSRVVPQLPPNKSSMADGSHIDFRKYALRNRWRHWLTVSYKDANHATRTTTAKRLSASNVVESVATTTTSIWNCSKQQVDIFSIHIPLWWYVTPV